MFIRKKSKTDSKNNKKYHTYQLVESVRTPSGPRQRILLSIGLNKDLSKVNQKMVANRIEEILHCYPKTFVPYPKKVEQLAQLFAKQLIAKEALETPNPESSNEGKTINNKEFAKVDLNSIVHSNCRTVGLEYITLETVRKLMLESKLQELGFSKKDIDIAIGIIIGKLVKPNSERSTHAWLKNQTALPELINCDFNRISQNRVYKISDKLLLKKDVLEAHLSTVEDDLFSLDSAIVFFDITNTYLEGSGAHSKKAKRGRSKEKRSDCPLVALGLVINSDGFPRKSKIYEGNISEPSTLKQILTELRDSNQSKLPIIVLDAGFATEENLKWLREERFPYIVDPE